MSRSVIVVHIIVHPYSNHINYAFMEALKRWQRHMFRPDDILLGPASKAVASGDYSRIYGKEIESGQWMVIILCVTL